MNRTELKEIRFDLEPRNPGGKRRVSYIEVVFADRFIGKVTCSEDKTGRTVRKEIFRAVGGAQIIDSSLLIVYDRKGGLESRETDVHPFNQRVGFSLREEFNNGLMVREDAMVFSPSGEGRYYRRKYFDPQTELFASSQEAYLNASSGSLALALKVSGWPGLQPLRLILAQKGL